MYPEDPEEASQKFIFQIQKKELITFFHFNPFLDFDFEAQIHHLKCQQKTLACTQHYFQPFYQLVSPLSIQRPSQQAFQVFAQRTTLPQIPRVIPLVCHRTHRAIALHFVQHWTPRDHPLWVLQISQQHAPPKHPPTIPQCARQVVLPLNRHKPQLNILQLIPHLTPALHQAMNQQMGRHRRQLTY